ncbi:MAG: sigma-54 dependent transcriptional regulator [Bacteroidetes bacterium]|nr:sigma-54 dependent transcriptional regulator [Bacteroidota bacterium]MBU1677586.1 sigma-54 dependent transcriptional regulator [Bacteroidota bacterium]
MNKKVLVVEDNDSMRIGIEESLVRDGCTVFSFDNGVTALEQIKEINPQIAIVDLKMEPMNGLDVLKNLKECDSKIEVLMISAYSTVDDAVQAMHLGAADFLTKPFSPNELRIRVNKIADKISADIKILNLTEQNKMLNEEINSGFGEIIGSSQEIQKVFQLVEKVAETESTVLIHGESGTGKELIARAIHSKSPRSNNPFVRVNCGALNENLLESELFGHEKGAFTGAVKTKRGRFELAESGTLFFDEVGDIPLSLQVKLLRVLQEREFERVGGEHTLQTDVRIIAATNMELKKLVSAGKFREDLFYRLNVIPIEVPPLRNRKDDIPQLVNHFINKLSQKYKKQFDSVEQDALKIFLDYSWPGNIRELENLIERIFVISNDGKLNITVLQSILNPGSHHSLNSGLEEAMFNYEKSMIEKAMKDCAGIKNRAAKKLGIKTSALYYKLEKFGLIDG